jgi:hypothetical protein
MGTESKLRAFVQREIEWHGTMSELAALLHSANDTLPVPARLAIWLRRHEPTLWWDHGVRIRFSRTGQQRRVHISRRDQLLARSLSTDDSTSAIGVVT